MSASIKFSIIILVITVSCYSAAHDDTSTQSFKFQNGLMISWQVVSDNPKEQQIELSDEQGNSVAAVNVLRLVPDARRVSIYDVSARTPLIAVAAVFGSKQGNMEVRPAASLLIFDFSGRLLSATALEPSRAIARLTIDDQSNIWTLTDHADTGVDPSTVPMVVKYTAEGKAEREILPRSMFPAHAQELSETPTDGQAVMGSEGSSVWFWLPKSTDFVTISSDGKTTIARTLLPRSAGREGMPLMMTRDRDGDLVAQVVEQDENGKRIVNYYTWNSSTQWTQFKPGSCEGGRLLGAGEHGQVYSRFQANLPVCLYGARR